MKIKKTSERYEAPEVELLQLPKLNLMANLSATGSIEDFEDGGEL